MPVGSNPDRKTKLQRMCDRIQRTRQRQADDARGLRLTRRLPQPRGTAATKAPAAHWLPELAFAGIGWLSGVPGGDCSAAAMWTVVSFRPEIWQDVTDGKCRLDAAVRLEIDCGIAVHGSGSREGSVVRLTSGLFSHTDAGRERKDTGICENSGVAVSSTFALFRRQGPAVR